MTGLGPTELMLRLRALPPGRIAPQPPQHGAHALCKAWDVPGQPIISFILTPSASVIRSGSGLCMGIDPVAHDSLPVPHARMLMSRPCMQCWRSG